MGGWVGKLRLSELLETGGLCPIGRVGGAMAVCWLRWRREWYGGGGDVGRVASVENRGHVIVHGLGIFPGVRDLVLYWKYKSGD